MEQVRFKDVANGCVFYIPKTVGLVACIKHDDEYGDIMNNIHYAYQKGMFKKFSANREVLINK